MTVKPRLLLDSRFPDLPQDDTDNKLSIQIDLTREEGNENLAYKEFSAFVRDLAKLLDERFDQNYSIVLTSPSLFFIEAKDE